MDALTHAIEAYVSTPHGPFTNHACRQIEMVLDNLPAYNCDMDEEQMRYTVSQVAGILNVHCLESYYSLWHIRQVQHSQQTHSSRMCECDLSSICYQIQRKRAWLQQNVMLRSHAEWTSGSIYESTHQQSGWKKIDDFNVKLNIPKTLKDFGIGEI